MAGSSLRGELCSLTPVLTHLCINPPLAGLQESPSQHWAQSPKGQGVPSYSPATGPASTHPNPIMGVDPRRGCPAFKMSPKPGIGHTLGEVRMVSIAGTETSARHVALARLACSPSQPRRGRDGAAIPRLPRGHVQIHIQEVVSLLPTNVEAPVLPRKANSYRQDSELSRATHRGKRMLQNPLQDSASSFPSLNDHREALHYKAQTRATQQHHHSPPSH